MLGLFLIGSIVSFLVSLEWLLLSLKSFHNFIIIVGSWASEGLIHIVHNIESVSQLREG